MCKITILRSTYTKKDIQDSFWHFWGENSNCGRESVLEVQRQNISGNCQQTFENKKFVDINQQCFALLPQVNFPANNLNFQ